VPWSPLARGLLTRPRPADGRVRQKITARSASDDYALEIYGDPNDWDVVDALENVAGARGDSMATVALAWLLSRPAVVAPIIGATKINHLDDAIAALDVKLTHNEIAALESPYRPHEVRGLD